MESLDSAINSYLDKLLNKKIVLYSHIISGEQYFGYKPFVKDSKMVKRKIRGYRIEDYSCICLHLQTRSNSPEYFRFFPFQELEIVE